ncbi:tetratricopeptide repeat protein [Streptomyces sp. NPDC055663]
MLADRERLLGNEHPHTLNARANLAISYQQAERTNDAIEIEKHVLDDSEHPDTCSARDALSRWRSAGRGVGGACSVRRHGLVAGRPGSGGTRGDLPHM